MSNSENHRIAIVGEPTCETCTSFNDKTGKCDSCVTSVGNTFKHCTCRFHLVTTTEDIVFSETKLPPRIIKIKSLKDRVETGALQFNDDWPGAFIRGDNAFYYAMALEEIKTSIENNKKPSSVDIIALNGLLRILKSSKL